MGRRNKRVNKVGNKVLRNIITENFPIRHGSMKICPMIQMRFMCTMTFIVDNKDNLSGTVL